MTVSLHDVADALERLCSSRPDERNPYRCLYTDPDTGHHCAVGEVLLAVGLRLPDIDAVAEESGQVLNETGIGAIAGCMEWDVEGAAISYLVRAQPYFDAGDERGRVPWGEAFDRFLRGDSPDDRHH